MADNETVIAYLTRAQEYADALANIGEPVKEKDLVMHVLTGLHDEYNTLKSTILGRQFPAAFSDLNGLISDHDYMVKKPELVIAQAFTATTTTRHPPPAIPADTLTALQQLMSQLGLTVQQSSTQPQAMYASRGRGRGYSNKNRGGRVGPQLKIQFMALAIDVASGIYHLTSPYRDPNTLRSQQPTANYADFRSQASTAWLPDTGSNSHVASDLQSFDNSAPYYGADSLHVAMDVFTRNTLLMGPSDNGLYSIQVPVLRSLPKVAFSVVRVSADHMA
ncbi:uncharacterized protein LOC143611551 [Bidens hawaiensis]|uniref:uncharacterized protein LOC143611551 n=1 Tax=Bidens hawaiensis TaxID=980011 RepID=UPI00404AABC6